MSETAAPPEIRFYHLARLTLSPEEQTQWGGQLGDVLAYMDKLRQLDVSGIEPMAHPVLLTNVSRPDEAQTPLPHAEALRNAPASANGLFLVPRIVE